MKAIISGNSMASCSEKHFILDSQLLFKLTLLIFINSANPSQRNTVTSLHTSVSAAPSLSQTADSIEIHAAVPVLPLHLFEFLILVSPCIRAEAFRHAGCVGGMAGHDGGAADFAVDGDEAVDVEVSGPPQKSLWGADVMPEPALTVFSGFHGEISDAFEAFFFCFLVLCV